MSSKWLLVLTFITFLQLAVSAKLHLPVTGTEVEDAHPALKVDPDSLNVDREFIRPRPTGGVNSVKVGEDAHPTLKVDPDSLNVDREFIRPRPTGDAGSVNRPNPVRPRPSVDEDTVNGNEEVRPAASIPVGSNKIDTSYYYRLTNNYSGRRRALDVVNDGINYALKMAPIGKYTGQFWYFVHLGNNVYNLRTQFLGNKYSLDIVNDGVNDKPHMALTGDYSGQRWRLVRLNDGTFRFHNEFSGNKMFLDVARNTHVPRMFNNKVDYSGQHWNFNRLGKI